MLQTTITSDKFEYYLQLARTMIVQYKEASDKVLYQVYLEKRYKKGDRYGWFKLHCCESDQTYEDYIKQELNDVFSVFRMLYYDGIFEDEIKQLGKIRDGMLTAIDNKLSSVTIDVSDITLLTRAPSHYRLQACSNDNTDNQN